MTPTANSEARRVVWMGRSRMIPLRTLLLEAIILLAFVLLSSSLLNR